MKRFVSLILSVCFLFSINTVSYAANISSRKASNPVIQSMNDKYHVDFSGMSIDELNKFIDKMKDEDQTRACTTFRWCIIAPFFQKGLLAPVRLPQFLSVRNQQIQLLLNRFAVKDESQKLHHIIIGQSGRLFQKGFQHSGTSAKAVGSLTSGQPL